MEPARESPATLQGQAGACGQGKRCRREGWGRLTCSQITFSHKKLFQVTSYRCHRARRCSEAPGGWLEPGWQLGGPGGQAPGTGVEEDTTVTEGTPGLSPPQAVTTSPLPPTAPPLSRALSLAPAPSGPHPAAPALGEEEEAHHGAGKPRAELEPGRSQEKLFPCSGAGKPIRGDTGEMSQHI